MGQIRGGYVRERKVGAEIWDCTSRLRWLCGGFWLHGETIWYRKAMFFVLNELL
jgi:hypothetical protein